MRRPLPEPGDVVDTVEKALDWYRVIHTPIGDALLGKVFLVGEAPCRIPQVRGKRLGLQYHALRREASPALERLAENLVGNAGIAQVRGDR